MPKPPVFLFAYANDRADSRYLRHLSEERRKVEEALQGAGDSKKCEALQCPNTTVDEVLNKAQRHGDRLVLFHFAGHADGKTLLFEQRDGTANATGARSIAEFLGGLPALKLVVLNGCSTQAQVDALLAQGVAAVVATSTSIKDEVATAFADRFYRALASSSTIADAFRQASGAVKATISIPEGATHLEHEAIRAVTRDVVPPDQDGSPPEWPWGLYGSDAATAAVLIGTVHKGWPSIYAVLAIAALVTGLMIYRNTTGPDKPAAMPSTLWLQVTKNEPAPWQEVAMPATSAPSVPATMLNRFDVLENGRFTRFADGYRDLWDPRDEELAQRGNAYTELEHILIKYGDERLNSCTSGTSTTARVICTHRGQHGLGANCHALSVDRTPADHAIVLIGEQARTVIAVDKDSDTNSAFVDIGEPIDAADGQMLSVCFVEIAMLSKPLLSFVHISDIQLRDPSVVLADRELSKRLDVFEPLSSLEYDEDLASYNEYLFESMVATINATAGAYQGRDRPSFVIHTGNSIDANVMSELLAFHSVIDRLRIPFFEMLGNHDVLVFGSLTPTDEVKKADDGVCTSMAALIDTPPSWAPKRICVDSHVKPCATCTSSDAELIASTKGLAETRKRFMDALAHTATQRLPQLAPSLRTDKYCGDTHPEVRNDAYSRAHGFDLGTTDSTLNGTRLGYYAFVQSLPDQRTAVFIALDSEDPGDVHSGIGGHVGHAQLVWLQSVLGCVMREHPHDLVFVFAHRPLSQISVDTSDARIEDILGSSPNVVAVLYGHNHQHAICADTRIDKDHQPRPCTRFWEIGTASLVEFPQEARMVRIKQVGQHLGFLEVSTFGERLDDPNSQMARYVGLARRGAERDHCVTHQARCSSDKQPYRTDGNSTSARLFFRLP